MLATRDNHSYNGTAGRGGDVVLGGVRLHHREVRDAPTHVGGPDRPPLEPLRTGDDRCREIDRALLHGLSSVEAVRGVSFELRAGEILALIGPNGAGKSTCFDMLNGQNTPDSGRITLLGEETVGRKPRAIWRVLTSYGFAVDMGDADLTADLYTDDTVIDPACGTGGFLLAAHAFAARGAEDLTPDQREHLRDHFVSGTELVDGTARLAAMNMLLHGVEQPDIRYRDSLAQDHAGEEEKYTLVLANQIGRAHV